MQSITTFEELKSRTHTPCLNCVFAQWNSEALQTGCQLGKIDLFSKLKDVEIVECTTKNGKDFFSIAGRICPWYRDEEWANKQNGNNLDQKCIKETHIKYDLVVTLKENEDLESIVNKVIKFKPKPQFIFAQKYKSDIPVMKIIEAFNKTNLGFKVQHVICEINEDQVVDTIIPQIKSPHCIWIKDTKGINKDFPKSIDDRIFEKLEKIVFEKQDNMIFFHTNLYKYWKPTAKKEEAFITTFNDRCNNS